MTDEKDTPFSPVENKMMDALEEVIDPELGIDLVNLSLIYDVKVDDNGECAVTMTLVTIGCPLGDILNRDITEAVTSVEGVTKYNTNLVWESVWDLPRMSRFAKIASGIYGQMQEVRHGY